MKNLSPWGIIKEKYVTRNGKEEVSYDLTRRFGNKIHSELNDILPSQ